MVQSDKYYKSRAVWVTSEVGLLLTEIFQSSVCSTSLLLHSSETQRLLYAAIPEVTWYEPLYSINIGTSYFVNIYLELSRLSFSWPEQTKICQSSFCLWLKRNISCRGRKKKKKKRSPIATKGKDRNCPTTAWQWPRWPGLFLAPSILI